MTDADKIKAIATRCEPEDKEVLLDVASRMERAQQAFANELLAAKSREKREEKERLARETEGVKPSNVPDVDIDVDALLA